MNKKNIKFSKFITPSDFFAVLIILIGIITAFLFDEIAIRMIGVSIAILGSVAMFMLISQRLSEVVEPRFSKTDFKVTTTKDSTATRQTVEDFENTFGGKDDFPITSANKPSIIDNNPVSQKTVVKPSEKTALDDLGSGMRIVGTINSKNENVNRNQDIRPQIKSTPTSTNATPNTSNEVANNSKSQSSLAYKRDNDTYVRQTNIDPQNKDINKLQKSTTTNKVEEVVKSDEKKDFAPKSVDIPISYFIEVDQILGDEPKKEFEYFITRVLTIIRSSTNTRSILLFLVNSKESTIILESYVTNVHMALKTKLSFPIGNDIVSQIVKNGKPQILSDINPIAELDIIPYYKTPTSTCSLVGVPVYMGDGIVGVIVADTDSSNAYNASTVAFMGHFSKLIGSLIKSYTHKYDLLQSSKTLEAVNLFYSLSSSPLQSDNLPDKITETLASIFPNASVGLVSYDGSSESWIIKSYSGSDSHLLGKAISIENTHLGNSIYNCETYHLKLNDNISGILLYPDEPKLKSEFVITPIKSSTQIFGAVFMEMNNNEKFTEYDISVIELIASHAGINIEKMYLLDALNNSAIYDTNSGLLNSYALFIRINEEIERSREFKTPLSLVMFKFDRYASLDPEKYPQRYEYAINIMIQKVTEILKVYDVIGKINTDTYCILMVNKDSNSTKFIVEKIRSEIAKTMIDYSGTSLSMTASFGISNYRNDSNFDIMITDADKALNKAFEHGNQIQIVY
ncbi:hypothetical protein MASR1M45_06290 [Candidatus Kapaibacterium sp.]